VSVGCNSETSQSEQALRRSVLNLALVVPYLYGKDRKGGRLAVTLCVVILASI